MSTRKTGKSEDEEAAEKEFANVDDEADDGLCCCLRFTRRRKECVSERGSVRERRESNGFMRRGLSTSATSHASVLIAAFSA